MKTELTHHNRMRGIQTTLPLGKKKANPRTGQRNSRLSFCEGSSFMPVYYSKLTRW
jgi:hypothetical protein